MGMGYVGRSFQKSRSIIDDFAVVVDEKAARILEHN